MYAVYMGSTIDQMTGHWWPVVSSDGLVVSIQEQLLSTSCGNQWIGSQLNTLAEHLSDVKTSKGQHLVIEVESEVKKWSNIDHSVVERRSIVDDEMKLRSY